MHKQQTAFKNIVGKQEIACNKQFLLFPQFFLFSQKIVSPFVNIFDIISLFAAELEEPKIGMLGKGSMYYCVTVTHFSLLPQSRLGREENSFPFIFAKACPAGLLTH